jgi:hypothetical protein
LVVGDTVIATEVAVLFHIYVLPPDAVSVALCPLQMVVDPGVIVATTGAFTVTEIFTVPVQPFASVAVMV